MDFDLPQNWYNNKVYQVNRPDCVETQLPNGGSEPIL